MEKRYLGIELHRNGFTCCLRLENGRSYLSQWRLEDLPRFAKRLRAGDELAMEITGNARLFYDAVSRKWHAWWWIRISFESSAGR